MGMALKADVVAACQREGTCKPVDLAHLSTITMGDRSLEREVLSMFCEQIPNYLNMAQDCGNDHETKRAAHTIRGAATNIGAFALAEMARAWEASGKIEADALHSEFDRIRTYVSELGQT